MCEQSPKCQPVPPGIWPGAPHTLSGLTGCLAGSVITSASLSRARPFPFLGDPGAHAMCVPSRHGEPREDNGEPLPYPRQEPTPAPSRPAPAMLPVPSQPQWGSPEHNWDRPPSPPRPDSRPAPPGFAPPRARSRISPGCSLEGLMLKLKLQNFGHLM